MNKKFSLITGANSGIGKEIALGLAAAGNHVIMVCRNVDKGQAVLEEIKHLTGSTSVDLLIADLSSQSSIRILAKTIQDSYPALDVLINNAGLVTYQKTYSIDGKEMTLATNYLAPFLLSNLLIDLLKKNSSARIINISSAIHKWAKLNLEDLQFEQRKYQFMKAYAQSKLLMNIMTFELARRLQGTGVTANCVHPGAVRTNLGSSSANNVLMKLIDWTVKFFFISPKESAKTTLSLALDPAFEKQTGQYFVKGHPVKSIPLNYNSDLAKKVWDITEKLVAI